MTATLPAICLNMIVRNEAHIVGEALDTAAPYISSWVIVDTGSDDGTQDVIREQMARLDIPGQLHERPWRNFGHNRTEALSLAQGRGDYIWVLDADDTVAGTLAFTELSADIYLLRRRIGAIVYWRPDLLRDGLRARWVGVTHEYVACDDAHVRMRLEGDYHIDDRQLSARNISGRKLAQDRDLLLGEIEHNPADARSVFYLAQSYFALGDFASAHKSYARRIEMGGFDQEIYCAMVRVAESMEKLDMLGPQIADAYLRAFQFRPTRAEAVYALARWCREHQRYQLGYLFARAAAAIPFPQEDVLFVRADIYAWRAADEQAVCAFLLGDHAEAFTLWQRVLACAEVPEGDRKRIAANRDVSVPAVAPSPAAPADPRGAEGTEPIIVVLGPRSGGTSAVAGVLHHLGVFMGEHFHWTYRDAHETFEDRHLSLLCGHAFGSPGDRLQMDPRYFEEKLCFWADGHRRAARAARAQPGAKDPLLCVAVDSIRAAWGPVVPVVVDRPVEKIVASLTRSGWLSDERERVESTAHLIAERDRALADTATIRVDFEELRATPEVAIRHLVDELGLDVTEVQIAAAVESVAEPADVPRNADRFGIAELHAKVERNPDNWWWASVLATAYFDSGDFANARTWYTRQVELGGPVEDTWFALWRIAESMARLDMPWPDVQDAYLRAWEFRPIRAEPLYMIARRYRIEKCYHLGYLFAERAARIPVPENDILFGWLDSSQIYAWQAADEQTLCGLRLGKLAEGFALCRRMLACPDIPDEDRQRIANNRDVAVPTMLEAAASYPDPVVGSLGVGPPDVTVSLIAGPDREATERALNSFLNCCTDVSRVGRLVVVDARAEDCEMLCKRYRFLEFAESAQLRERIGGRFWFHLGQGWRFFAPEGYVSRLTAVLDAEPQVFQVGINFGDASKLTGLSAAEAAVRRAPGTGRYVLTDVVASGPAMFDTARLDYASGLRTATLDEVLCISGN